MTHFHSEAVEMTPDLPIQVTKETILKNIVELKENGCVFIDHPKLLSIIQKDVKDRKPMKCEPQKG